MCLRGPGWAIPGPTLAVASVLIAYARTRRAIASAMPAGSVATAEVLDDRIVSRVARWAREIRYDDIRHVDVRGDVVFVDTTSAPGPIALPRALVPDDLLERLRGD